MGHLGLHKADIALSLCKEDLGGEGLSGRGKRGKMLVRRELLALGEAVPGSTL